MSNRNKKVLDNTRLTPNSETPKNVAVPRKLPGIVIFLHGVNDPGASYQSVETGLCQGLNERLDRDDLHPGVYGAAYAAAKKKPEGTRGMDENDTLDDPDTHLYRRKDEGANSVLIPFYWGYRAAKEDIKRDATGGATKLRTQYQDSFGNRLDRNFGKAGGFFANATNNLPEMYGKGFDDGMRHIAQFAASNTQYFGKGPHRRYYVLAAERLATLIATIRSQFPSETITVMGHSQGTLITLLAQAMLVERNQRCADCVIMVDTPYSLLAKTTPAGSDTLGTLIDIVDQVTGAPYGPPSLKDMQMGQKESYGRAGNAWTAEQGQRIGKDGQMLVFPERDNRGKVFLYFCPDDTTVALDRVAGIGTYGVPDSIGQLPAMDTLREKRFYQRMWTKRYRNAKPVVVGEPPRNQFLRAVDEPRYPGDSWVIGAAALEPVIEGTMRLINGEALTPQHAPQLFGGEEVKGTPTTVGKDRPDDVSKAIAMGNPKASFKWIELETSSRMPNVQEIRAQFNEGKAPDDQTQTVKLEPIVGESESLHMQGFRVMREETANEIRARMATDVSALEPNSYHSGVLRHPENHRWVTAMDVAIGQAHTVDDPQWRELLMLMADWRMTPAAFGKMKKNPLWSSLEERTRQLAAACHDYYRKGLFPGNDLVQLDRMPSLVKGNIPS